ncbi:MAG: MraY family glycosyltransferase, partial [Pseudomonadota bacterium]
LMIFGAGVSVTSLGDPLAIGEISVGPLMLPVTVILAVAVINAINMTDGMDGLAGSFSLVALLGLSIAGFGLPLAGLSIVGVAVVASFLVFNFPIKANRPIRTFMGDAGSTFLGLVIAWLCVSITQPPNATISPVVALGFVALPLFDLTSCFFRRIFAGRSPFTADRNHFHHVLQEAGLTRRQILAVLLSLAVTVMLVCLGLHAQGVPDALLLLTWAIFGFSIDASLRWYRRHHDRRATVRT